MNGTKTLAITIAFLMLSGGVMVQTFAKELKNITSVATTEHSITPSTPSQDGDGYYLIGSVTELYGFAELVNNGNAIAIAKLTADIVVNENILDANGDVNTGDFVQWTPIGSSKRNYGSHHDDLVSGTIVEIGLELKRFFNIAAVCLCWFSTGLTLGQCGDDDSNKQLIVQFG